MSRFFSNRKFLAITDIISRNLFVLVNGIIFVVAIILISFGDVLEGIFLCTVTFLNIIIGCTQEIRAWITLDKLQSLAIPKVTKINSDSSESQILKEEIKVDDNIKLKIGEQVPCDGVLTTSHGFEVSEALLTGESSAYLKKPGDEVFAGSIITSGSGIMKAEKIFAESKIALMTKDVKKYTLVLSQIQSSVALVVRYISYVLFLTIVYVVVRGYLLHTSNVRIVQSVGALTSILLPQGLIFFITLIFSYGAIHMYKRNILLQDLSATEKIGRIKYLCIDKTGTLTENVLYIDRRNIAAGIDEKLADASISAYIKSDGGSSESTRVIKESMKGEYTGSIIDDKTFSSTRQFGAVHIKDDLGERVILSGAPDVFKEYFSSEEDRKWIQNYIDTDAKSGKRLICFAQSENVTIPESLPGIKLKVLAIYVLNNNLREGAKDMIEFFQNREATVMVLSGDNPDTVQAISNGAGVKGTEKIISGADIENWTEDDYVKKVHDYVIFARVKPEQKEKIIEAYRKAGFTAMVGDGANDALAIKKADLGIAMFDGAPISRQIASIVLIKNTFVDLPNGVKLADSIIQNIGICASFFFNQTFLSFFFYVTLTSLGYLFPFTPLNITFIDYFIIGLPLSLIFYWIVRPEKIRVIKPNSKSFLKQTLPYAFISALIQAPIILFAFYSGLAYGELHGQTSLVILSFIMLCIIFFIFTPTIFSGPITKTQKMQFILLIAFELISILILVRIPIVKTFYNLKPLPSVSVFEILPIMVLYVPVQYGLTWLYIKMQSSYPKIF